MTSNPASASLFSRIVSGLALLLVAPLLVACDGDPPKPMVPGAPVPGAPVPGTPAAAATPYVSADHTGRVTGVVRLVGDTPAPELTPAGVDDHCNAVIGEGRQREKTLVNADGTLPHTFVWAWQGPHAEFEGYTAQGELRVTQAGCRYSPHVFGVLVGQVFVVENPDDTAHDVNMMAARNDPRSVSQPPHTEDDFVLKKREARVRFVCKTHGWMEAWCFALDHPFFATTDAAGRFDISGLPAGDYVFKAWHEMHGEVEIPVTVGAESLEIDVELTGK